MSVLSPEHEKIPIQGQPGASKYTVHDLRLVNDPEKGHLSPLAVIAHIDLNAFYAQCEQIRMGKSFEDPVVCAQWQSLIAVSYAARKYGIGRMDTLESALKKCPGLVVGHAAVFKKGESHWQYLNRLPDQAVHKVSLDPYRRELRKIIGILARECDITEKASVDECYLDLGRLVLQDLFALFPDLEKIVSGDSVGPLPPVLELCPDLAEKLLGEDWLGRIYETEAEAKGIADLPKRENGPVPPQINDWDDVLMLLGCRHLFRIRKCVFDELGYTTSGGLGLTKSVAKLAGGFNKPDFQTVVRTLAVFHFFRNFGLDDFTLMGGKIGEVILEKLDVPKEENSITYIRKNFSLSELKSALGAEENFATKVYELVHAVHRQELKRRTVVKLMMSRKNFVSKVNTLADAYDWIRVFAGDLYGRFIELDDENLNLLILQETTSERFIFRPRTISVQVTTQLWVKHLRQMQFPVLKQLEKFKHALETTGFRLLCELMAGTKAAEMNPGINLRDLKDPEKAELGGVNIPPLANMGLVVLNFVKTSDANLIDSYGAGGSTQEAIRSMFAEVNQNQEHQKVNQKEQQQQQQQQRQAKSSATKEYVRKLFAEFNESRNTPEPEPEKKPRTEFKLDKAYVEKLFAEFRSSVSPEPPKEQPKPKEKEPKKPKDPLLEELIRNQFCSSCNVPVSDVFEHKDLHLAMELSARLNEEHPPKKRKAQSMLPFAKR